MLIQGGILIIDERNYQRIFDNRVAALKGELHSSGKYIYTGTDKVSAGFVSITVYSIIIEYTQNATGKKSYYKVFPFKKDELLGLLQEAGFSKITKYSDYSEGNNSEADFFQYVCVR